MSVSIHLQDVTFGYRASELVLDRVSFDLDRGSFLAVVGPNGAGKSTLIGLVARFLKPLSGDISIDGRDIRSYGTRGLATKVAVVRQEFVPAFGFSVAEMVLMARIPYYGQLGFERKVDRDLALSALEVTDTARFADRPLSQLSGGERQRVFMARALAQDTPIILLDEPTSFLDLRHQVGIYDLLKTIQQDKGRTIVAVTHEINLAAQYCDQVLMLRPCGNNLSSQAVKVPDGGRWHYRMGPTAEVFTSAVIEEVFGVPIFSASIGAERVFLPLGRKAKDAGMLKDR
jgi:iron complex transport system ATP-binding protein